MNIQEWVAVEALKPNDLIALVALVLSTIAFVLTLLTYVRERRFFEDVRLRERHAQVAANYLALETQSSEIFKYTAENEELIGDLRGNITKKLWNDPSRAAGRAVLLNLYYQSLNLFEVCARFRRNEIVEPEVFASWLAWFLEILEDSYFRSQWRPVIRSNYTSDVRRIFDVGLEIFEAKPKIGRRDEAFYAAVAEIMAKDKVDCAVIARWPTDMKEAHSWRQMDASKAFLSNGGEARTTPGTPPGLQVA